MAAARFLALCDLIDLSISISGASSLSSAPPPPKRSKFDPNTPGNPIKIGPFIPQGNSASFSSIKDPVIIIGKIDLFPIGSDVCTSCQNHCLSFSQGSSTVCCSVLDFGLEMVGMEVYVLAWNYVPFKHYKKGGVLEIIGWCFSGSEWGIVQEPFLSILPQGPFKCADSYTKIFGLLKAVSPLFSASQADKSDGNGIDSVGFLAEIHTCDCHNRGCFSSTGRCCDLFGVGDCHSYTRSVFVYFVKPAFLWRPAVSKLVGMLVCVFGLKKKKVYVGEVSFLMHVSTTKTVVSICRLSRAVVSRDRVADLVEKNDRVYCGVVTGIYMQGMAVELDERVWLSITDLDLAPFHSLRVGSMVRVANFHLVHCRFSWIGVNVMGTCNRTSIIVKSYSPNDTRCHFKSQTGNLLGNFIGSLIFCAKFWMLLSVSSFKKKFVNILSDKEILGSKRKEGLVQFYATRHLPSSAFLSQNGLFMDFCKHGQCSCFGNLTSLKLVVPISDLRGRCKAIWNTMVSELEKNSDNVGLNPCCCNLRHDKHTTRLTILSEELGFHLVGKFQISPSSGQLQFFDATGSIDVLLPDLSSYIDDQAIYEVENYKVIMEGLPKQLDCPAYYADEKIACQAMFKQFTPQKTRNSITVFVHFHMKDLTCINVSPVAPYWIRKDGFHNELFHLLLVTHKFPFQGDLNSRAYAEALIFPRDRLFLNTSKSIPYTKASEDLENKNNYINFCSIGSGKAELSALFSFASFLDNSKENVKKLCCGQFSQTLNCSSPAFQVPCYLSNVDGNSFERLLDKKLYSRALLEFDSDSFMKYQMLQIGAFCVLKCSIDVPRDKLPVCAHENRSKVLVNLDTTLLTISLSFDGKIMLSAQSEDQCFGLSSGLHRFLSRPVEIMSVSSCVQIMMNRLTHVSRNSDRENQMLPQAGHVSLTGIIQNIHTDDDVSNPCNSFDYFSCPSNTRSSKICIHVSDGNHLLKIRGNLSKAAYPVGLAPGTIGTFYRVICSRTCYELILTPFSFIFINSIEGINSQQSVIVPTTQSMVKNPEMRFFTTISVDLISNLNESAFDRLLCFNCRVVGIQIVVLTHRSLVSESRTFTKPCFNIPLGGFILDDGSSLCCCWANGIQAEMLLGLHRGTHRIRHKTLKSKSRRYKHGSVWCGLKRMLEKHHKITVKGQVTVPDISSLNVTFSLDSNEVFGKSDERLLRSIISRACHASMLHVEGMLVDSNTLRLITKELQESHEMVHMMKHFWVTDVQFVDALLEARDMLSELGKILQNDDKVNVKSYPESESGFVVPMVTS